MSSILVEPDFSRASAKAGIFFLDYDDILQPLNRLLTRYTVLFSPDIQHNLVRRIFRRNITSGTVSDIFWIDTTTRKISELVDSYELNDMQVFCNETCGYGKLADFPEPKIEELREGLLNGIEYPFYALTVQATNFVMQTDFRNALLYVVFAFESAHSELVERYLDARVPDGRGRSLAETLLREAGISAFVELSPYLFMEEHQRPSTDIIRGTVKAIRVRNKLAHSKRDRSGQPSIDHCREHEFRQLFEATLQYINAIAKVLP